MDERSYSGYGHEYEVPVSQTLARRVLKHMTGKTSLPGMGREVFLSRHYRNIYTGERVSEPSTATEFCSLTLQNISGRYVLASHTTPWISWGDHFGLNIDTDRKEVTLP